MVRIIVAVGGPATVMKCQAGINHFPTAAMSVPDTAVTKPETPLTTLDPRCLVIVTMSTGMPALPVVMVVVIRTVD